MSNSECKGCSHEGVCKYNDGTNQWCCGECPMFEENQKVVVMRILNEFQSFRALSPNFCKVFEKVLKEYAI